MTTVNIDSPTQSQFQLPRRNMRGEDGAKNLVGAQKWCNKVTGCISYGYGMMAFCAHESLGGGANLMLTCLHLTLLAHVASGRSLGEVLHCQMDNTTGKCLAWAVQRNTMYHLPHQFTAHTISVVCLRRDEDAGNIRIPRLSRVAWSLPTNARPFQ